MDLSKLDAEIQIEARLATVRQNLKALDELNEQRAKLQSEFEGFRADEAALLKQEDGDHEKKLTQLLKLRGSCDLKAAAIGTIDERIARAEEALSKAGEATVQFLSAYHAAVVVALQDKIQSETSAFIQPEDIQPLMQLASRHQNVRQVQYFAIPSFQKWSDSGYANDIREARMLESTWGRLSDVADKIGGTLAVSIPETWL